LDDDQVVDCKGGAALAVNGGAEPQGKLAVNGGAEPSGKLETLGVEPLERLEALGAEPPEAGEAGSRAGCEPAAGSGSFPALRLNSCFRISAEHLASAGCP